MNKEQLKNVVNSTVLLGCDASKVRHELMAAVDQLDEPKHEPVEVEPFVAEYLDTTSLTDRSFGDFLIYNLVVESWEKSDEEQNKMEKWIRKKGNKFILADALRYGYVRKEKQWTIIKDNGRGKMYLKSYSANSCSDYINSDFYFDKGDALIFTDKAKAEAVATLVGGKAEETTS